MNADQPLQRTMNADQSSSANEEAKPRKGSGGSSDSLSIPLSDIDSANECDPDQFIREAEVERAFYRRSLNHNDANANADPLGAEVSANPESLRPRDDAEEQQPFSENERKANNCESVSTETDFCSQCISLKQAMDKTAKSMEALVQWDKDGGLRRSYSRTMSDSRSSRILVGAFLKEVIEEDSNNDIR